MGECMFSRDLEHTGNRRNSKSLIVYKHHNSAKSLIIMTTFKFCLLLVLFHSADAYQAPWIPSHKSPPSFGLPKKRSGVTMDIEGPDTLRDQRLRSQVDAVLQKWKVKNPTTKGSLHSHGMPWKKSIDPSYTRDELFYMPFWRWQIKFMEENLTNLQTLPVLSHDGQDMSYKESADGSMRIHTARFSSDEYKNIRLTVLDAGSKTQVFTSLWYPDPHFNLPVLGTDLLQFNEKKHLCVVDFQPIQDSENLHAQSYEEKLKPIRDQYSSLQGSMTKRFYDETQFFSSQMLLARDQEDQESEDMVFDDLMPAWQQYVQTHVNLVKSTPAEPSQVQSVQERQAAYDEYSAVRDPAHGLLARSFGQDWADAYVYDILFPQSSRPE